MTITIKVDDREVKRLFGNLKHSTRKILSRSLNRTITGVRTDATKEVSKQSGAQVKFVRRSLRKKPSKPARLIAELQGSSYRLPVKAFRARQTKKGVTFLGKNGQRKLIKSAFIQTTTKGYKSVWKRKSKAKNATGRDSKGRTRKNRLPLRKLKAISVGNVLTNEPVLHIIHKSVDKRWHKAIKSNIELELNGKKIFKP